MVSASAMAESLPDWMIMPRTRSDTATGLPASMNVREPIAFCARADGVSDCASSIRCSRSAWNTRYAVMSLVSDAGSKRSFSAAAASVWPLKVSTTM